MTARRGGRGGARRGRGVAAVDPATPSPAALESPTDGAADATVTPDDDTAAASAAPTSLPASPTGIATAPSAPSVASGAPSVRPADQSAPALDARNAAGPRAQWDNTKTRALINILTELKLGGAQQRDGVASFGPAVWKKAAEMLTERLNAARRPDDPLLSFTGEQVSSYWRSQVRILHLISVFTSPWRFVCLKSRIIVKFGS